MCSIFNLEETIQNGACEDENEMTTEKSNKTPQNIRKVQKPPPIIMHRKLSVHRQFVELIKANTNHHFSISYAKESTCNYLTNDNDWKNLNSHSKMKIRSTTRLPRNKKKHTHSF